MFLTSIALCCLMLNVQSQDPYYSKPVNQDYLYFSDNLPQKASQSLLGPAALDKDAQTSLFQDEPQKKRKPSSTVEIEKSSELAFGSSIAQSSNADKQNIFTRQTSTPRLQTEQQLAQNGRQIAQDRRAPQIGVEGPREPQRAPNRPNVPEMSLIRPSVVVPQSALNRPTVQQITLGGPQLPQKAQDRPSVPQAPLSRPTGTVSQAALDRPNAPQAASPPKPSYNIPSESPKFNKMLYSVTNFGINLLKNIDAMHPGNVVVSPYSITSILALLQQGARGETQQQITDALSMTPEESAFNYAQYTGDIQNRKSRNTLNVANNLFLADVFVISPEFKRVAERSFNSDITALSYNNPDEAARQINSWVASKTNNKIEKLISPDSLDSNTQMVLVNAIYFKGLWEVPFRVGSTAPGEFRLSSGQTKTAQYMHMRNMFRTGKDPSTNANVIILPFEHDEYHLMVILPSQLLGLKSTLSSLTDARLLSYLSFDSVYTDLELPKFTIRADTDLKDILTKMGISTLFGRLAELSGVGEYRSFTPRISSAVHSAVLSIDEHGGSAAAATAFAAVALSYDDPAIEFKVNRPFIAVLWDNRTYLPLFIGKVEDPQ